MPNITLHVAEPDAVTLRYVEAKIKPEQVAALIMAGGSLMAYIIGEGLADSAGKEGGGNDQMD